MIIVYTDIGLHTLQSMPRRKRKKRIEQSNSNDEKSRENVLKAITINE